MKSDLIELSSEKELVTTNRTDAFGVVKGIVRLYMVPFEKDSQHTGRRQMLCDITEGNVFPALAFTDHEGNEWRFLVSAASENAQLERIPYAATNRVKERLAKWAEVPNLHIEGFENSFRSFYLIRKYQEEMQLWMEQKQQQSTNIEIYNFANYAVGGYGENRRFGAAEQQPLHEALAFLCKKARIELPSWDELSTRLEKHTSLVDIAEAANLTCREVTLEDRWYRNDCGMLISTVDEEPVALFPRGGTHYIIYHTKSSTVQRVTKKIASLISTQAFSIGRALPQRALVKKDLVHFIRHSITARDLIWLASCMLMGVLMGLIMPVLNQKVYDDYIPMGDYVMLRSMCLLILTFLLCNLTFSLCKKLLENRICFRAGNALQDAIFHRMFHLPNRFFQRFDSADLTQRVCSVDEITRETIQHVVITGLSSAFSLVSLVQMIHYSPQLSLWGLLLLALFCLLRFVLSLQMIKYETKSANLAGTAVGKLQQYIAGIEKIRLAGAEDRALLRYVKLVAERQLVKVRSNRIAVLGTELSNASKTIILMVLYGAVVHLLLHEQNITAGRFMAFNAAFGTFSAGTTALINATISLQCMKPIFERLKPLIDEEPESDSISNGTAKRIVRSLTGRITLKDVSFAYQQDAEPVLHNLSLEIQPGEYIGIVGESGCGKSTLFKLLLGFEEPTSGSVWYDEWDLSNLNKQSLRRCIGTVLQDGKLIAGSIYENISISADHATLEEVETAMRSAALEAEIQAMPMGLQTWLSEDCKTISGGQKQRILIARAFCGNPSILIFDEPTSALDNIAQKQVCCSLKEMDITRIIIAHRLSTIQNCDRILVFENGRIVQDGTYEELINERNGMFFKLAERQLIEQE